MFPDKRLKAKCIPVDFETTTEEQRLDILRKLGSALFSQNYGMKLGIAAPQVGLTCRVMIVMGIPMFNPEWHPANGVEQPVTEGCYSLPENEAYRTWRPSYGWAKWYDEKGVLHEEKVRDMKAIVFQHELDHLSGTCCNEKGTLCKTT